MRNVFIIVFISILFLSCKKDKNQPLIDGIYKGTFKIIGNLGSESGNSIVTLNQGNFISQSENNNLIYGGSGTYNRDVKTISFTDTNARVDLYVYFLLLNESYTYFFDGKNLKIFTQKNSGYYELNLVKQ